MGRHPANTLKFSCLRRKCGPQSLPRPTRRSSLRWKIARRIRRLVVQNYQVPAKETRGNGLPPVTSSLANHARDRLGGLVRTRFPCRPAQCPSHAERDGRLHVFFLRRWTEVCICFPSSAVPSCLVHQAAPPFCKTRAQRFTMP